MKTITEILHLTPFWTVYGHGRPQGEIELSLLEKPQKVLVIKIDNNGVFGDYFGTRYEPEPRAFNAENSYIVDNLRINDTTISGILAAFSNDFAYHEFLVEAISEDTLQLTMTYHKETAINRKQATINEDNDMQIPREYLLSAIK